MFAAALGALGMLNAPATPAACVAMSFILSFATLGEFSDPTFVLPVVNDSGLVVQLQNLTCPALNIGKFGVRYNSTDMRLWVEDSMDIDCYMGIDIQNKTANFSLAADLHFSIDAFQGQEIHITAQPTLSDPCLAQNATLSNMTLRPVVSALKLVPDEGINSIIDLFVLPLVQASLTTSIQDLIFNLSTALAAEFNNNTIIPLEPSPILRPGATPLEDWGVTLALHNIVNNLPAIGGLQLNAEFHTETTLRLNISLPSGAFIGAPSDSTYFNIPSGFMLSLEIAFDYLICNDAKLSCIAANGIKLMNIRLTGAGELDRLVDNAIGPLIETLLNGLIAGAADKDDGSIAINIPDDAQIITPPLWVTLALGPILSIAASCCVAYSAYRHIIRPVLNTNGEKISFLRIFFEDSIVTATCFGCIYLFVWSNTTSAASVVVGDAIPVYNFALMNTVEDLWKAGLKPLSILVFFFSGVYPYFKLLSVVTFSVILQRPQSRTLRIVDNLGKFSLLDTFVMTILKAGLEINGLANVNAHPSFYVFVTATVLSILVGNYATHGWRRETTVWLDDKEHLLIQEDDGVELSDSSGKKKVLSKQEQQKIIDKLPTEVYVERLSATVRRKKAEDQDATKRRYSPNSSAQNSATSRNKSTGFANHLDVMEINRNTVRSPVTSGSGDVDRNSSAPGPTPTITENYGTTSNTGSSSTPTNSRTVSGEGSEIVPSGAASNLDPHEAHATTELLLAKQQQNVNSGGHESKDGVCMGALLNTCLVRNCFSVPEEDEFSTEDLTLWIAKMRGAWEWYLGLPLASIVLVGSVLSLVFNVLRYNITGIALIVVANHKDLTMWDMFLNCDWYLLAVGLWSIIIAPVLYIATYPHSRSLAAWCATDAFLLACVAGLLQLESFISFILGPEMQPVYSATCSLLWPLIPMFIGMLIQWFFIFKQMLNITGIPTLQKIKDSYNSSPLPDE